MGNLRPALGLLALYAGRGEKSLPALLWFGFFLLLVRAVLRLLFKLAAAYPLRNKGSYYTLLRALGFFLANLYHRIASGDIH